MSAGEYLPSYIMMQIMSNSTSCITCFVSGKACTFRKQKQTFQAEIIGKPVMFFFFLKFFLFFNKLCLFFVGFSCLYSISNWDNFVQDIIKKIKWTTPQSRKTSEDSERNAR